jgi:hypothetical protein
MGKRGQLRRCKGGRTKANVVATVVRSSVRRIGKGVAFAVSYPVQSNFCPISRSAAMFRAALPALVVDFMKFGRNE